MAYERSLKTDCAKYFDSVHHYCYSCQVTKHVMKEKCTRLMNFSIMTKNKNEHMYSRVKSYDIQNKKNQEQAKAVKKLIYQYWTKCHICKNYSTKNKLDDRIEQYQRMKF